MLFCKASKTCFLVLIVEFQISFVIYVRTIS